MLLLSRRTPLLASPFSRSVSNTSDAGGCKWSGVGEGAKSAVGELSASIQRHIRQRNMLVRMRGEFKGVSASNNGDIISANKKRQEQIACERDGREEEERCR